MQKKNSGKKPIDKIVVCGCSYSLPGQSGVKKIYSDFLQEHLSVPVENITYDAGAGNSEILRRVTEYCWSNDVSRVGFIVQWSSIERLEFCDEKQWYSTKRSYKDLEIQMKIDKIKEAQAYTYSESTHLWNFIQQVMALDGLMKQNKSTYFQVYCIGLVLNNLFHQIDQLYFSQFGRSIYKSLSQTPWLNNNILQADLTNQNYPVVSADDPHFSEPGHQMVANAMINHIRKEQWL